MSRNIVRFCPSCVGVRVEGKRELVSTIGYRRVAGYCFCRVCGRRWSLVDQNDEKKKDETYPITIDKIE
jgi:hypothetical protein